MLSLGLQCQVEIRVVERYFQKYFVKLRSCTTRTWCLKGESAWQAHHSLLFPHNLHCSCTGSVPQVTRQELYKCLLQDQHVLLAPMLKRECMENAQ